MNKNQNTLTLFVYETIENPQKRNDFLATFAEIIGAKAAAIAVADLQLRWATFYGTYGMDQGTIDSYCQYYFGLNPYHLLRPRTAGEVRRGLEVLSEKELQDTEFYHGFYKPRGWLYPFTITLGTTETECAYILALRPPNHPWAEKEMAIVNDLAPHLAVATQIEKRLRALQNTINRLRNGVIEIEALAGLNLTPTESRIVLALSQGQSVKEYAYKAGLAADTVRWHVKRIYKKLGVRRQADLARLLLKQ